MIFQGGLDPYPPVDPQMYNVAFWHEWAQTSLCGLLLSLETPNANRSIVFKQLAKALIRLRKWADWSKPLVLAHTTLLEISYFGPFIGAKNALRLYIRAKLHLSDKGPVTSFIKNM